MSPLQDRTEVDVMGSQWIDKIAAHRGSRYAFALVSIAVAFNFWGVFDFSKLPIPHFVDWLYGYLVLNVVLGGVSVYSHKPRPIPAIACPQCGNPLEATQSYECPSCGKLEFRKETTLP